MTRLALIAGVLLGCGQPVSPDVARERVRPSASAALAAEAWEIDPSGFDCTVVDERTLRCPCSGPRCERALQRADGLSDGYTAGRGEQPWSDRFVRNIEAGTATLDVYGDPAQSIEIWLQPPDDERLE